MTERTYTKETLIRVYDDADGWYIEIGTDPDGLDLIEMRTVGSNGTVEAHVSFPPAMARLVVDGLQEVIAFLSSTRTAKEK